MKLNISLTHNTSPPLNNPKMSSPSNDSDFVETSPKKRVKLSAATLKMNFETDKNLTESEFINAMHLNSTVDLSQSSDSDEKIKRTPKKKNLKLNKVSPSFIEIPDESFDEGRYVKSPKRKVHNLKKNNKIESSIIVIPDDSIVGKGVIKSPKKRVKQISKETSSSSSDDGVNIKKRKLDMKNSSTDSSDEKGDSSESSDEDIGNLSQSKNVQKVLIEKEDSSESSDEDIGNLSQSKNIQKVVNAKTDSSESSDEDVGNLSQSKSDKEESSESSDEDMGNLSQSKNIQNVVNAKKDSSESSDEDVVNLSLSKSVKEDSSESSDESNKKITKNSPVLPMKKLIKSDKMVHNRSLDGENESSEDSTKAASSKIKKNVKLHKLKSKSTSSSDSDSEKQSFYQSLSTDLDESIKPRKVKTKNRVETLEKTDLNKFCSINDLKPIKFEPISDLLKESKEVFMVKVPNFVNPHDLKKLELSLTYNRNIKINGQDFYTECKNDISKLNIVTNFDDKYSMKPVTCNGTVAIKRAYSRDEVICFKVKKTEVKKTFQNNLAEACSLLDTQKKSEVDVEDDLKENVDEIKPTVVKKKKKKQTKVEAPVENYSQDLFSQEYAESEKQKDETITVIENNDTSKKKKHKKAKIEIEETTTDEIQTEGDSPKKKAKKKKKHKELVDEHEDHAIASSTFINSNQKVPKFEAEISQVSQENSPKKLKKHKLENESFEEVTSFKKKKKKSKEL